MDPDRFTIGTLFQCVYLIKMSMEQGYDADDWNQLIWYTNPTKEFPDGLEVVTTDEELRSVLVRAGEWNERKVHLILQDREAILSHDHTEMLYILPITVPVSPVRFNFEKHHLEAFQKQKHDNGIPEDELGWLEKTARKWYITNEPTPKRALRTRTRFKTKKMIKYSKVRLTYDW